MLRIEDTDLARNTLEGYRSIIDSLNWLGIDWDEGPEVGGDVRALPAVRAVPDLRRGRAGRCARRARPTTATARNDEVEARRKASGSKNQGYDGFCRELDPDQLAVWQAEGRHAGAAVPDAGRTRSSSTTWCAAR